MSDGSLKKREITLIYEEKFSENKDNLAKFISEEINEILSISLIDNMFYLSVFFSCENTNLMKYKNLKKKNHIKDIVDDNIFLYDEGFYIDENYIYIWDMFKADHNNFSSLLRHSINNMYNFILYSEDKDFKNLMNRIRNFYLKEKGENYLRESFLSLFNGYRVIIFIISSYPFSDRKIDDSQRYKVDIFNSM